MAVLQEHRAHVKFNTVKQEAAESSLWTDSSAVMLGLKPELSVRGRGFLEHTTRLGHKPHAENNTGVHRMVVAVFVIYAYFKFQILY